MYSATVLAYTLMSAARRLVRPVFDGRNPSDDPGYGQPPIGPAWAKTRMFWKVSIALGPQRYHTLAIFQRLAVVGACLHWDVVAGRRLSDVELPAPVRAGDTLQGQLTIEAMEPREPGRSLVTVRGGLNVADVPVLTLLVELYVRCTAAG
jgi:acyl dehydratase